MKKTEWDVKCGAAIIGMYAVFKLCEDIDFDPEDMYEMVQAAIPQFRAAHAARQRAEQEAAMAKKREKLLREEGWAVKITGIAGKPVDPFFVKVCDIAGWHTKDEAINIAAEQRVCDRQCKVVPVALVEVRRKKGKVKK